MKLRKILLLLLMFLLQFKLLSGGGASGDPIGFEVLDGGTVWHIWNARDDYYFNATSGIQVTNHYDEYWTHNVFCAGYKGYGQNESLFQDDFESWSTTEDCDYTSSWSSCYPGSGMVRGIDGALAYDGTSLVITDSAGDNVLMKCGDLSEHSQVWVSFWGRRWGLDPGEYCRMDVHPFGGNWTTVFDSGNGTDGQYYHQTLDVTPYISNYTCVLLYSNANETNEGCGVDDFNITAFSSEWHYDCNDALPFNWSHVTDNTTYVNITGYRDREVNGRLVRLALRYHLKTNDANLTVIPYVENLGSQDIPNDLGFAWHVNDVRLATDKEHDWVWINDTNYDLHDNLNLNFTNMTRFLWSWYVNQSCWGECNATEEKPEKCDEQCNVTETGMQYLPLYRMFDPVKQKFLTLGWKPAANYTLLVQSKTGQYNAPVTLFINAGPLASGQSKSTRLEWIDANTNIYPNRDWYTGFTFDWDLSDGSNCSALIDEDISSPGTGDYIYTYYPNRIEHFGFTDCPSGLGNVTSLTVRMYIRRGTTTNARIMSVGANWTVDGTTYSATRNTGAFPTSWTTVDLSWANTSINYTECNNLSVRILTIIEQDNTSYPAHQVAALNLNFTYEYGQDDIFPSYSNMFINDTVAGKAIEHSLRWDENYELMGYVFSFDNGTGTLVNDSWTPFSDGICDTAMHRKCWTNTTKVASYTPGDVIRWCFYANDSGGNWNASCDPPYNYTNNATKTLLLEWAAGSGIDPASCPEGSPCQFSYLDEFVANATVTCVTDPPGHPCGVIYGSIKYNDTTSTYAYLGTNPAATPFYVIGMENLTTPGGTYDNWYFSVSGQGIYYPYGLGYNGSHFFVSGRDFFTPAYGVWRYRPSGTYDNWFMNTSAQAGYCPSDVIYNGTYFWVAGCDDNFVYRYWSNGTYSGWSFNATDQVSLEGIAYNGTHFWGTGCSNDRVSRYRPDGTYDNWNFNTTTSSHGPHGVEYNGTWFWVLGNENDGVYRHWPNGTYAGVYFGVVDQDGSPEDIAYYYPYFYIIGEENLRVYRYLAWDNYTSWNPVVLGHLWDGESLTAKYFVNATDPPVKRHKLAFNVTSSHSDFPNNQTAPAYVEIVDSTPPTYSGNSTNTTAAGQPVMHSLLWTDTAVLDKAVLSFDNCTGTLQNISTISLSGSQAWSNFTVVVNYAPACTIQWCIWVNDSAGNLNGSSCNNPFSYQTQQLNRTLRVSWTAGSEVDSASCPESTPCSYEQNQTFNINATVECYTDLPGYGCGEVAGGIMYNTSASGYDYLNVTTGSKPFRAIGLVRDPTGKYDNWNFYVGSQTDSPEGVTTNSTHFWVVDDGNSGYDRVYRYRPDGTYDNWYFDVGSQDTYPYDVYYNGTYFWVVGANNKGIYRYWPNGTYSGWFFNVSTQIDTPNGIYYNGTYFWVTDYTDDDVYRYWSNGTYSGWSFDITPQESQPQGIVYNGTHFWIVGSTNDRVYRYLANGTYDNWYFDVGTQDDHMYGMAYNGTYFWVIGWDNYRVYRYLAITNYSNPAPLVNLSNGDKFQLNFTLTANEDPTERYRLLFNFSSDLASVPNNQTDPAYVEIYYTDPPKYSDNSTNSTGEGEFVSHNLHWVDGNSLSGYTFAFYNGTNWTLANNSHDKENGEQSFVGAAGAGYEYYTSFESDWGYWVDDGIVEKWTRDTNGTSSSSTGPCSGSSSAPACGALGTGWYIYVETSTAECNTNGETAIVYTSPAIDFGSGIGDQIHWWNNMYGTEIGTLSLQENTTGSWIELWTMSGNKGTPWFDNTTDLSSLEGTGYLRFHYTCAGGYYGDAAIDEINVSAYGAPGEDGNKTAVEYLNALSGELYEVVSNITVTVYVSYYNTSGSVANGNKNATLWLEVYNGTGWADGGEISATGTGNFSRSVTASPVRAAWATPENRDIRVSARFIDYNSSGKYDTLNWSGVWVEVQSEQEFLNDSWTTFSVSDCTNTSLSDCWSNTTKLISSQAGATIKWCYYANDSTGKWNSSCFPAFSYQATGGEYIAITFTSALQSGLEFGSFDPGTANSTSNSCLSQACNITVSGDTTVNVDIVTRVDSYLTRWGGAETIEEQYWNSTNSSQPTGPMYKVHTTYDYTNKVGTSIQPDDSVSFNSWLSVPSAQITGLYNNTLYFCATETGTTDC